MSNIWGDYSIFLFKYQHNLSEIVEVATLDVLCYLKIMENETMIKTPTFQSGL